MVWCWPSTSNHVSSWRMSNILFGKKMIDTWLIFSILWTSQSILCHFNSFFTFFKMKIDPIIKSAKYDGELSYWYWYQKQRIFIFSYSLESLLIKIIHNKWKKNFENAKKSSGLPYLWRSILFIVLLKKNSIMLRW